MRSLAGHLLFLSLLPAGCLLFLSLLPAALPLSPASPHRRAILASPAALLLPPSLSIAAPPSPIPKIQAGSVSLSASIQGYWQLAGGHGAYSEPSVLSTMQKHYEAGLTSFDTADIYGPSEAIVGKFTKKNKIGANTKFCVFRDVPRTKDECRRRVQASLGKLGKIDVLQFFWADTSNPAYVDVALWLAELRAEGLYGELGVTNFALPALERMVKAGVPVRANQVQCSAMDRRVVRSGQAAFCKEHDIRLVSFGTVGSGILSERYLNRKAPGGQEQDTYSLRMYSTTASRFGSWDLVQELLTTMDSVAANVRSSGRCASATIANVAQRFVLQTDPTGGCLLVGVRNADHIEDNVNTHRFQLEGGEVDEIQKVVDKAKGPRGDVWDLERGLV
ncbi:hypothetical protein TeGR_g735 [Tetraparma gracilis]|uniref:NADP-dependent oxidoreductase domain-containing protein n=1 Tax=Tetraparma gracilis TaxID=2962635 RepID=A0ABQ6NBB2_9STRA|nr:hypothetical protein TeGR_g735 [Tetraparma gracilis]